MTTIKSEKLTSPEALWSELNNIAPLSEKPTSQLKSEGWEEFFSFREFENNGTINTGDIEEAINEINRLMPASTRETDWKIVRARYDDISDEYPLEQDRLRALLRIKTEERLAWEKGQTK